MPSPSIVLLILLSGLCLFAAIHHLSTSILLKQRNSARLTFALLAFLGALYPLPQVMLIHATDPTTAALALRLDLDIFLPLFLVFMWFTALYTEYGLRTWRWYLSGALLALFAGHLTRPFGLLANGLDGNTVHTLPWGESLQVWRIFPSPWAAVYYAVLAAGLVYATLGSLHLLKSSSGKVGRGLLRCMVLGWVIMIHDLLVDFRVIPGPYLASWVILAFILYMSVDLIVEWKMQEDFFENLSEQMSDAVFVHNQETGAILYVNQTACRMYGEERADFLRMGMDRFMDAPPFDRASGMEHFLAAQSGPQVFPWCVRRKDGSRFWVEISLRMATVSGRRRMIAIGRDITDRMAAEEALRESEQRFRNVVRASPLGMHFYRLEKDGRLVFTGYNPSADRLLKATHDQFIGKTLEEAFPSLAATEVPDRYRRAAREGVTWHTDQVEYKDDRIEGAFEVYAVQTEPGSMAVLFQDVTERRRAEEERRRMESNMREAQRLESLGLLAGGIAHDFNNLLQAVRGHADTLVAISHECPDGVGSLQGIQAATVRAADLCRQLLAYAGQGPSTFVLLDLRQVVSEIGKMIEVGISRKARLDYRFTDPLPAILADATQIRQVVLNLLTNASEALDEGMGSITVSVETENLPKGGEGLAPGPYVKLQVSDTGAGMDEEVQSRIFEPFFTTKFTGRGLGLAAVQGILRTHGGTIRVKSVMGQGTTFTLHFPAAEGHPGTETAPEKPAPTKLKGRILLADDDEDVRLVTRRMLERLGLEVEETADGLEAAAAMKAYAKEFAGMVIDLTMPGLDGIETIERIALPNLPTVLISGYGPEEVRERLKGHPKAVLLQKPFSRPDLARALEKAGLSSTN